MLHWLNTYFDRFAARTKHLPVRASAARSSGVIIVIAVVFVTAIVEIGNIAMTALRGYPITNDHYSHILIAIAVAAAIAYPVMLYSIGTARALARTKRELAEAAEEAERANRMKSTFLATTSHEIRTPLNAIIGMAEMLRRSVARDSERAHVAVLGEAAQSLSRLLTDILDISKVEAGRLAIAPEPTDLHALLEGVVALWRPQASEKGVTLRLAVAPDVPAWVEADGPRLRQCLGNLLSNAIKFTPEGPVSVSVSVPDSGEEGFLVSIAVRDSGPGLSPEEQAQLFQPFEQVGDMRQRRRGAGLGLAISRNLARLMGGDVTLESEKGAGACFTLSFRAPPAQERLSPAGPVEPPPPLSILVVDDTATNLLVARLLLSAEGHAVTTAESGAAALRALSIRAFDVVLLDIHMPEMDGPETLRRIRESPAPWSGIPVIALTADAMSGDRARYVAAGMDGYASKPLEIGALQEELSRVVGVDEPAKGRRRA